jgi:hypothetical protein
MIHAMGRSFAAVLDRLRGLASTVAVSIDNRSRPAASGGDAATQNLGSITSDQTAQVDAWEGEGGAPTVRPPASSETPGAAHLR